MGQILFLTWFFAAFKVKEMKNHIDVFFQWLSTKAFSGFCTGWLIPLCNVTTSFCFVLFTLVSLRR